MADSIKTYKNNQRSRFRSGPLFNHHVQILNLSNGWFVERRKDKQMKGNKKDRCRNIQSIVLAKFIGRRIAANSAPVRGTRCGGLRGF